MSETTTSGRAEREHGGAVSGAALGALLSEALRAVGILRIEIQVMEDATAEALRALDKLAPWIQTHHRGHGLAIDAARRELTEALDYRHELREKLEDYWEDTYNALGSQQICEPGGEEYEPKGETE